MIRPILPLTMGPLVRPKGFTKESERLVSLPETAYLPCVGGGHPSGRWSVTTAREGTRTPSEVERTAEREDTMNAQ